MEIQARLLHEVQLQVSISTVKRYLKRLGVKLLAKDIEDGRVTMETVFEAVDNGGPLTVRVVVFFFPGNSVVLVHAEHR